MMTEREKVVFDLCVACLGAFQSKELGGFLLDALPEYIGEQHGQVAEQSTRDRLAKLIGAVDHVLEVAETIEGE